MTAADCAREGFLSIEPDIHQAIVAGLPGILCLFDRTGTLQLWNRNLPAITGIGESALADLRIDSLITVEDHQVLWEGIETASSGGAVQIEVAVLTPVGPPIPHLFHIQPLSTVERDALLAVGFDIADHQRMAARLRVSEERLRLTLSATNIGLYDLNVRTGEAVVNPEYARMLGYDPAEFHETNNFWRERLHPDDRDRVYRTYSDYIAGRVPEYRVEFRQRTRDGAWVWILSLGKIVAWDSEGRPLRMLGTHADVSDQKVAEAALEKSEERLRQAVEFANIGIFDHYHLRHPSPDIYWSREFRALIGIPPDAPLDVEGFIGLVVPEDRPHVVEAVHRSHDPAGDGLYEAEYRVRRPDGSVRWLAARGQTFFAGTPPDRHPIRSVGAAIDVTERKANEVRLAQARDELEARVIERTRELAESKQAAEVASETKSRFLAMMSHEIRTPLNGITGVLHLLRKERLNPQQQRWIDIAFTSAKTLLHVINDILDFSKVEAGKLRIHPVAIDLPATLAKTIEPFAQRAAAKGLSWDFHLAPGLPRWIEADPQRLAQILGNLIGNAIKFTDAGSVQLQVDSGSQFPATADATVPRLLHFAITDTGPGLSPAEQALLFKPFSQVDNSTTRRHGGTGLGLGICKHLVELLGGTIGVNSQPGRGSTFWFEIPWTLPATEPATSPTRSPLAPESPAPSDHPCPAWAPGHRPRVLVAEDDGINQELACEMIRDAGFDCDCVPSGQDAVTAAAGGHHALVFMDCRMPGLDGFAATRFIRQHEVAGTRPGHPVPHLPIVAMTANALDGDREACLAAGMDDYLAKPLEPDAVQRMLHRWVGAPHPTSPPVPAVAPPSPTTPPEPAKKPQAPP